MLRKPRHSGFALLDRIVGGKDSSLDFRKATISNEPVEIVLRGDSPLLR